MRHIHVGEDNANIRATFQDCHCLSRIGGFDRIEACILDHINREQPQQRFVFYDKDEGSGWTITNAHYRSTHSQMLDRSVHIRLKPVWFITEVDAARSDETQPH